MFWASESRYPLDMPAVPIDEGAVLDALKVVRDPDLNRDIVSLGFVKNLSVDGGKVAFTIELTTPACPVKEQMRDQARAAVMQIPGVTAVDVQMTARVREAVGHQDLVRRAGPGRRVRSDRMCWSARRPAW